MIQCSEINQTINYLLNAFDDCKNLKSEDMKTLVELIAAVNTCANGGPDYNNIENDVYEFDTDTVVTYPPNSFHSISVVVSQGQILYDTVLLPAGTSINLEFTTTNQHSFSFTVKAGSKVLVNYVTETI